MSFNNVIFVSILNYTDRISIQNKVAVRCNTETEDIKEVAKTFFDDVCKMDNLKPYFYTYEIFIKDKERFYKIEI